ncbi:MAG: efflux RND transporter periplasmic adaptor subunit [Alcanivorax sp.]|nr:efflux RND transporter periplasmic adaptor subunit [Alcanivorax sp.]
MNRRMFWMLLGCVLVFGTVFGMKWFGKVQMNKAMNNMGQPPAAVSTATAHEDQWALSLQAVGTIKAVNGVQVTTQAAGEVRTIHFQSGDQVKKGDLLVALDARADQANLNAAEANARLAEQDFNRYQRLYKQGSVSKSELDNRRAQRDQTRAQATAQRQLVDYKTIKAPFDGELGIRQVDLGQYLQPGTPIVTLQQLAPIYVDFTLPEQNLATLKKSLNVHVTLDAYPNRTFDGKVTAIEPGADPETRNFKVQATLANDDHLLRPGMFANVDIQLPQSEQVVVIPRTAVSFAPYGNAVFVITDGKDGQKIAKKTFIKLGHNRGDLVAVTNGLKSGDEVATSGLLKLRNNGAVKIENDVKPQADANPNPANS